MEEDVKCLLAFCGERASGDASLCDAHLVVYWGSAELRRALRVKEHWRTAFDDFIRRVEAEQRNGGN